MTNSIAKSVTKHTILVCVKKKEQGLVYQTLLSKAGYKVVTATSAYDALKFAQQEMPHLLFSEAILVDGTAGLIYDRLQQDEILRKIPLLVSLQHKTREEVSILANRQFAGVFLGKVESRAFLAKVSEIMGKLSNVSPYFVSSDDAGLASKIVVSFKANVLGVSGENIVSLSSTEIEPRSSIICVPDESNLNPAIFKNASNFRKNDTVYNMFPLGRIIGKGRQWLKKLPQFHTEKAKEEGTSSKRKLIYYDTKAERAQEFARILNGYDIDLVFVKSPMQTITHMSHSHGPTCIYLHELTNDAKGIEWKNAYNALEDNNKLPTIVGTTSLNARSSGTIQYIKRPFGLGHFLDVVEAAFESIGTVNVESDKQESSGVPVSYQLPATLLGLDESGGIIEVKTPVFGGTQVEIAHDFLAKVWQGNKLVTINGIERVKGKKETWQIRFNAVGVGMNKAKYWSQISSALNHLQEQEQTEETKKSA